MEYFIIALMCFLAVTKVTLQSQFSKSRSLGFAENIFYNFVMFLSAAILFIPTLIVKKSTPDVYIFGFISGVLSVGFQLSYMFAFSHSKPILVTTINNFSMFIPIAVSCLFLQEHFNIMKLVALLFVAVSIYLITAKNDVDNTSLSISKKGLIFILAAFCCNGLMSSNQKIYAAFTSDFDAFNFVAVTYVTAAVLTFFIFLFTTIQKKEVVIKKKEVIISAGTAGVFLGVFQCVSTYAASVINGVLLYSVYNCATNILFAVIRMIFFKEKLSKKQIIGVILGIFSILLMQ